MTSRTKEQRSLQPSRTTLFTISRREYEMVCGLSDVQLKQAYQLRAAIFCRELGWVGQADQSHETDEFDHFVHHLGIESENKMASYLRIHPAGSPWMVDRIFKHVVPPSAGLHNAGTCEVSRLAVAREFRGNAEFEGHSMFCRAMQLMFAFCQLNDIHTIFTIVSAPILRLLQDHGLPFKAADSLYLPTDRNTPVFAILSWPEFLCSEDPLITRHRPAYLETEKNAYQSIRRRKEYIFDLV